MPNWITNKIRITGSEDEIKKLKDKISAPVNIEWFGFFDIIRKNNASNNLYFQLVNQVKSFEDEMALAKALAQFVSSQQPAYIVPKSDKKLLSLWEQFSHQFLDESKLTSHEKLSILSLSQETIKERYPVNLNEFDFQQEKKAHVIDFRNIIPLPESAPYEPYNQIGSDWNRINWGTSKNACHQSLEEYFENGTKTLLEIRFDTAWNTPYPVFEALSSQFPEVVINVVVLNDDHSDGHDGYIFSNGESVFSENYTDFPDYCYFGGEEDDDCMIQDTFQVMLYIDEQLANAL